MTLKIYITLDGHLPASTQHSHHKISYIVPRSPYLIHLPIHHSLILLQQAMSSPPNKNIVSWLSEIQSSSANPDDSSEHESYNESTDSDYEADDEFSPSDDSPTSCSEYKPTPLDKFFQRYEWFNYDKTDCPSTQFNLLIESLHIPPVHPPVYAEDLVLDEYHKELAKEFNHWYPPGLNSWQALCKAMGGEMEKLPRKCKRISSGVLIWRCKKVSFWTFGTARIEREG